jgi:cell wall-associated NlpC family hydrolase
MLALALITQLAAGTVTLAAGSLASPVPAPPVSAVSASDEARLTEALRGLRPETPLPALMVAVAERFIGLPYLENSLNVGEARAGTPEPLVSRLDGFDCVTLVEASLAIARSLALGDPSPAGFRRELEGLRYRDGRRSDFASRLNYFSEWISNNAQRGNLVDLTPQLGGVPDPRPLTFMTTYRKAYPALADDGIFAKQQAVEAALAQQPRSVIPMERAKDILPRLQPGDILAFTTQIPGLDVVHTGMVARGPSGALHFLHAPEPGEPVTISSKPLSEYFGASKRHKGLMVARPLPATR